MPQNLHHLPGILLYAVTLNYQMTSYSSILAIQIFYDALLYSACNHFENTMLVSFNNLFATQTLLHQLLLQLQSWRPCSITISN